MILEDLYNIIQDRKENGEESSYTKYLFNKGTDKILKKVGEECTEVIIASKNQGNDELVNEICDLIYHLLVLIVDKEVRIEEINKELLKRKSKINNFKGERKTIKEI